MLFSTFFSRYTTEITAGMLQYETLEYEWHEIGVLNYVIKRARKEVGYSNKVKNYDIFRTIFNHYTSMKKAKKITKDFILKYKAEILTALNEPEQYGTIGVKRLELIRIARAECGYKPTTPNDLIWSSIETVYYEI